MSGTKRPAPSEWPEDHDRDVWRATKQRTIAGEFTDLVIECGGQSHKVHKLIMSASPFFAKATQGPFKEAKEGIIRLPDDDPDAIKAMIDYLYHGCYGKSLRTRPEREQNIPLCNSNGSSHVYSSTPHSTRPIEVSSGPSDESSSESDSSDTDAYTSEEEEEDENALVNGNSNEWRQAHNNINAQALTQANAQALGHLQERAALKLNTAATRTATPKKKERPEGVVGEYSEGTPATVACLDLPLDAMLYGLGEKYGLSAMKELALGNFKDTMRIYPRNVLQDLFREAAMIVYDSTPDADRGLRNVVIASITHFEHACNCRQVRKLLDEVPGLEKDVSAGLFRLVAGLRSRLKRAEEKTSRLQAHYDFGEASDGKHVRVGKHLYKPL